jgi:hypothetical protein
MKNNSQEGSYYHFAEWEMFAPMQEMALLQRSK